MSNTFFIDANVVNATRVNDTFNRFTYKLPNSIELPTGTEIGLQSSIINLQGITGASIEITEDIEETIIYQYYTVDTNYPSPLDKAQFATNANVAYNLNIELSQRFHQDQGENAAVAGFPPIDNLQENKVGYSEEIMPLLAELQMNDGTRTAVPMLGKSKISIPKGVYGINKLADEITNQINLNRIPNDRTEDFFKYQRFNNEYSGLVQNNATLRSFVIESNDAWTNCANDTAGAFNALTRLNEADLGALDYTVNNNGNNGQGLCSVIAVSANTSRKMKANAAGGGFGAGFVSAGCSFEEIIKNSSADKEYFIGWEKRNQYANDATQPTGRKMIFNESTYNPFTMGIMFGTSQFKVVYDNDHSAYTFSYLHQPRKIPSSDRFGTSMDNAGQECVYLKNFSTQAEGDLGIGAEVAKSLRTIIQKQSGILVTNWAYDTCRKLGDRIPEFQYSNNGLTTTQKASCDEYKTYLEFFTTDAKAEEAWATTLWARMGFQYNDIQNQNKNGAGQRAYFQYNISQTLLGFTTDQAIDISISPSVSTIFNPIDIAAVKKGQTFAMGQTSGTPANNLTRGALPAVSNIQRFNLQGYNVPLVPFSNNVTAGFIACISPDQGSFDTSAIMPPVITMGKPFVASKLPTLSTNGYLMITSDLVESNDIVKNQQTDGLLDIIPKSSLSNQDYMADRNIITHTLSNPKSINEININILNPDMTDITLEPNSQVLVRITLPTPKPTNFIQAEEAEAQQQAVGSVVANMIASHTDPNKAQTNMRVDISNLAGVGGGAEGVGGGEVELAQQAIIQNALDDALQGIAPPLPQGGLNENAEDLAAIQATGQLAAIGIAEGIVEHDTSPHSGVQYQGVEDYSRGIPINAGGIRDYREYGGRNVRAGDLRDEGLEEDEEEEAAGAAAGAGRSRAPPAGMTDRLPREVLREPEYPARGS